MSSEADTSVLDIRAYKDEATEHLSADNTESYTKIVINDLMRDMFIGVYDFEKSKAQPVKINLELMIDSIPNWQDDEHQNTVCYAAIVDKIDHLLQAGHINLVETLAEKIAALCLEDNRVKNVKLSIYKTDIVKNCAGVGVEIFRTQS